MLICRGSNASLLGALDSLSILNLRIVNIKCSTVKGSCTSVYLFPIFCPFGKSNVALISALCRFQSISTGVLVFYGRFHFFFQKERVRYHNTPSCQVWARSTVLFRRWECLNRITDFQTYKISQISRKMV